MCIEVRLRTALVTVCAVALMLVLVLVAGCSDTSASMADSFMDEVRPKTGEMMFPMTDEAFDDGIDILDRMQEAVSKNPDWETETLDNNLVSSQTIRENGGHVTFGFADGSAVTLRASTEGTLEEAEVTP